MNRNVFWIFGVLQSLSLAAVIYLLFTSLNEIKGSAVIGPDTHVLLSVAFPLFLLLVEYVIYARK